MNDKEIIEKVANMLAAAYWRGRLDTIRSTTLDDRVFEVMIKAAAESDKDGWKMSAKQALSL
jgi:hypothetical protein